MKYLVHLSVIYENSVKEKISAFAYLCDHYSKTPLTDNCFSFFSHHAINIPWVALKYQENKCLIDSYTAGAISREQFLDNLLDIFYFLNHQSSAFFKDDDVDYLFQKKAQFISLAGILNKTDLTGQKIARALMEEAWTSGIDLPDDDRFGFLLAQLNPDDSICFISNSNDMDINTILRLLKENYPHLNWFANTADQIMAAKPLVIADNLLLAVSHQDQALLMQLLGGADKKEIVLISPYPKDLEQARLLGIPEKNCRLAQEFFLPIQIQESVKMH